MKKRVIALFLLLTALFSFIGCSAEDNISKTPRFMAHDDGLDIENYGNLKECNVRIMSARSIFDKNDVNLEFWFGSNSTEQANVILRFKNLNTKVAVDVATIKSYPGPEHRIDGYYPIGSEVIFDGISERPNYKFSINLSVPSELFSDDNGIIEFYIYYLANDGKETVTNSVEFSYKVLGEKVIIAAASDYTIANPLFVDSLSYEKELDYAARNFIKPERIEKAPPLDAEVVCFDAISLDYPMTSDVKDDASDNAVAIGYKRGNNCYICVYDFNGNLKEGIRFNYSGSFAFVCEGSELHLYLKNDNLSLELRLFSSMPPIAWASLIYECQENADYLDGISIENKRTVDGKIYELEGKKRFSCKITVKDETDTLISVIKP